MLAYLIKQKWPAHALAIFRFDIATPYWLLAP